MSVKNAKKNSSHEIAWESFIEDSNGLLTAVAKGEGNLVVNIVSFGQGEQKRVVFRKLMDQASAQKFKVQNAQNIPTKSDLSNGNGDRQSEGPYDLKTFRSLLFRAARENICLTLKIKSSGITQTIHVHPYIDPTLTHQYTLPLLKALDSPEASAAKHAKANLADPLRGAITAQGERIQQVRKEDMDERAKPSKNVKNELFILNPKRHQIITASGARNPNLNLIGKTFRSQDSGGFLVIAQGGNPTYVVLHPTVWSKIESELKLQKTTDGKRLEETLAKIVLNNGEKLRQYDFSKNDPGLDKTIVIKTEGGQVGLNRNTPFFVALT